MFKAKVLVCAYTCSPTGEGERFGGGEDILGWNMVIQLARFHTVWVLSHWRNRSSVELAIATHPELTVNFHYFGLPSWLNKLQNIQGGIQLYAFLWQMWAYIEARRLHKVHEFQVFHHVTYANDWMASYIGALLPITYVRGPCGGAHRTPKNYLNLYGIKGRIWETIRTVGQKTFKLDPFFLMGQRKAKALLVCNKEAYEAIPSKLRYKTHMFSVCGVSAKDLSISLDGESGVNVFKVIAAGKLLRLKGFDMAIRAFALFNSKYPQSMFTVYGNGPESSNLGKLTDSLGLKTSVEFVEWTPRQELLKSMAKGDVFLFPSLRDGGGAVVVEAMAMKTPVICLDISGPSIHVTRETGIKISITSPEESIIDLADALERLYLDPELLRSMADAARTRVEQIYNWDKVGERINDIYQNIFQLQTPKI